jgi:hypothetical protein
MECPHQTLEDLLIFFSMSTPIKHESPALSRCLEFDYVKTAIAPQRSHTDCEEVGKKLSWVWKGWRRSSETL